MSVEATNAPDERRAAFETVVSTYEGPLLRFVARVVSDRDAAQDVVQETFVRLFRHWRDPLAPSPQLGSWLYRVAYNRAVDHIRKASRHSALVERQAQEQPEHALPDPAAHGGQISEAAERAAAALKTLSLREQQLVILKVYEEKSYREIGDITGLSVGNVGYILHHAMKKLAQALRGGAADRTTP